MKNLLRVATLFLAIIIFSGFGTDSKLTQESAENAIRWFVIDQYDSTFDWRIVMIDIVMVNPINQFTEKDARCTAVVKARVAAGNPAKECNYTETELTIDFNFKKDAANKWILRGIDKCVSKTKVNNDNIMKFTGKNRNINMAVE